MSHLIQSKLVFLFSLIAQNVKILRNATEKLYVDRNSVMYAQCCYSFPTGNNQSSDKNSSIEIVFDATGHHNEQKTNCVNH